MSQRMKRDGMIACWCKFGICVVCGFVLASVEMIAGIAQTSRAFVQ
jgi:hypothetical protein